MYEEEVEQAHAEVVDVDSDSDYHPSTENLEVWTEEVVEEVTLASLDVEALLRMGRENNWKNPGKPGKT